MSRYPKGYKQIKIEIPCPKCPKHQGYFELKNDETPSKIVGKTICKLCKGRGKVLLLPISYRLESLPNIEEVRI
jgi:hypothetical protein